MYACVRILLASQTLQTLLFSALSLSDMAREHGIGLLDLIVPYYFRLALFSIVGRMG